MDDEPQFPPRPAPLVPRRAAVAPTITGSDSGGGAGIRADLESLSALGVGHGHGPVHRFHLQCPSGG